MTPLVEYVKHFQVTGWGWWWITWFFGGFGLPEAYGLLRNTQDTLSWQIWGLEQVNFKDPFDFAGWTLVHWVMGVILLGFVVWLGLHMIFGIIR